MVLISYSRVLITTDVWARGIDVQQVSLVINYDLPAYVQSSVLLLILILLLVIVKIISIVLVAQDASDARASPSTYVLCLHIRRVFIRLLVCYH